MQYQTGFYYFNHSDMTSKTVKAYPHDDMSAKWAMICSRALLLEIDTTLPYVRIEYGKVMKAVFGNRKAKKYELCPQSVRLTCHYAL